jgi:transposase InsO family protein
MVQDTLLEHPEYPRLRVCSLLGVPRSGFYRAKATRPVQPEAEFVERIEAIVLEFSSDGSRRIAARLKKEGWAVGRKRVQRVMRERSLLCQIKRRWVRTTDSGHSLRRYPNLTRNVVATRVNQIWHSDITYIRLPRGFCYLATVLDSHSRKVVGWSMSLSIDAALVVAALKSAIESRKPPPGWIHHSDQGVQYACKGYVQAVGDSKGQLSMSSKATPYDNAKAESFFATLKKEEVYLDEYLTFDQAQARIGRYIDAIYNNKRLHSRLGYASPEEFEATMEAAVP